MPEQLVRNDFESGIREPSLTPENCVALLIDHQPFRLSNVKSHDPTIVIKNVTDLAKSAKAFGIPTILSTVNTDRGGAVVSQLRAILPHQKPIERTLINAWEDRRVVEAVTRTGRRKLIIAALWTEMCLAMPAMHAMEAGYDVYVVTDASGGVTKDAHDMAIRCLAAVGARPITWLGWTGELQRARSRRAHRVEGTQLLIDHPALSS
jgi:nicotinamidase-related amidase